MTSHVTLCHAGVMRDQQQAFQAVAISASLFLEAQLKAYRYRYRNKEFREMKKVTVNVSMIWPAPGCCTAVWCGVLTVPSPHPAASAHTEAGRGC